MDLFIETHLACQDDEDSESMAKNSTNGPESLRSTLGEYSPCGFFTKTWFEPDMLRKGAPNSPTYEQYWYVWSTILHEWVHHLQMVGTTYGRFHYDISLLAGGCTSAAIRQLIEIRPRDQLRRPLLQDLMDARHDIDEDSLLAGARALRIRQAFWRSGPGTSPVQYSGIALPQSAPSPRVIVEGKKHALGAVHILEGHARSNELVNLVMTAGRESFCEALEKLGELDPYRLVEELITARLVVDDEILCRIICDIAMNPPWPAEDSEVPWEDFHPGWRMVRIVDALKDTRGFRTLLPHLADEGRLEDYHSLYEGILNHFGWQRPEQILPASAECFPWYTNKVVEIRTKSPLAFALNVEHLPLLQKAFPISVDEYVPEDLNTLFASGMDPLTEFEARRVVARIFEKTVYEMLNLRTLTCPIHLTVFPSAAGCPSRCAFQGFFKSTFGITVDQFCAIPFR